MNKVHSTLLVVVVSLSAAMAAGQARTSQPQTPPQKQPQAVPTQPSGQRQTQSQGGKRAATQKPPMPMTLRQVVEALSTTKNSKRVEDMIAKAGVLFQATPGVLDILKEFGASPVLLAMIPPAPVVSAPAAPAAPKVAGPLTVSCEPKDCRIMVDDAYQGRTTENRTTIRGLHPGEVTIEVFADGYEGATRRVQLEEGKPAEQKFALKRSTLTLQQSASATMLKVVAALGGTDGFGQLADIEGAGMMQWKASDGKIEEWTMSFNKRVGKDLSVTFKTKDGQCTARISREIARQDCRAGFKNGGDKIAAQGSSLFLSYQLQDVIQALVKRSLIASERDENTLESPSPRDSYVLTIGADALPARLLYRTADGNNAPIQVEYANYFKVADTRYPGKISIGRANESPSWVFVLNNVKSKLVSE